MAEPSYVTDILNDPAPPAKEDNTSWVKELMEEPQIGGTYQPVPYSSDRPSGISTITNEPIKSYVPGEEPGAGMVPLMKNVFLDDPKKQIEVYAEARGIPTSRYRIHNGEIIFRNKEGKWQREVGELPTSMLKKAAAQAVNPAVDLGVAGSFGGPGLATVGAMLGENIRQGVGAFWKGDFPEKGENVVKVMTEGVLALGGEALGGVIKAAVMGHRMSQTGLKAGAGALRVSNLNPMDHAKAEIMRTLANQHGIDLPLHQAYDKASLEGMWLYLRKHPATADKIREVETKLGKQGDAALRDFISGLEGGAAQSPIEIGEQAKIAAGKAIGAAEENRASVVRPLYDKAFQEADLAGGIDLYPVMDEINKILSQYNTGKTKGMVATVKKSLLTESVLGKTGKRVLEPETDLRKIQKAIFELNDHIEGTSREAADISPSVKTDLNRDLMAIKSKLLEQINQKAPTFLQANAKHAELTDPIDSLKRSVVGELTRLSKDNTTANAAKKLFSPSDKSVTDAEILYRARSSIEPQDPDLWKRMIGSYIKETYEGLVINEGDPLPAFIQLRKRLFGSATQQNIMEAAMGKDLFKQFSDLMTVINRSTVATRGQSMTKQFDEMGNIISGTRMLGAVEKPLKTAADMVLGRYNDALVMGRHVQMLDAMLEPEAVKKLSRLKQLTPGSKKLIDGLSEYTTMVLAPTALEGYMQSDKGLPAER